MSLRNWVVTKFWLSEDLWSNVFTLSVPTGEPEFVKALGIYTPGLTSPRSVNEGLKGSEPLGEENGVYRVPEMEAHNFLRKQQFQLQRFDRRPRRVTLLCSPWQQPHEDPDVHSSSNDRGRKCEIERYVTDNLKTWWGFGVSFRIISRESASVWLKMSHLLTLSLSISNVTWICFVHSTDAIFPLGRSQINPNPNFRGPITIT